MRKKVLSIAVVLPLLLLVSLLSMAFTRWLQGWVCHRDTDAVAEHLRGAQVGLTLGDETLFFSHTAALAEALEHLHHRDDVTLSNLL